MPPVSLYRGSIGRAKTDRLDTELLKRGFLGWLRGERVNCTGFPGGRFV
jgi:hypothetical protein